MIVCPRKGANEAPTGWFGGWIEDDPCVSRKNMPQTATDFVVQLTSGPTGVTGINAEHAGGRLSRGHLAEQSLGGNHEHIIENMRGLCGLGAGSVQRPDSYR